MKKIILTIVMIMVASPILVGATTSPKQPVIKPELMKARLASTTEKMEQKREEMQQRIASTTQKLIDKKSEKAVRNLRNEINRLYKIASSTEQRIAVFTKNGFDMGTSTTALVEAKNKILTAETKLNELIAYLDTLTITAKNRGQEVKNINTKAKEVEKIIKSAHESLVKVMTGMKNRLEKREQNRAEKRLNNATTSTTTVQQ